MEKVKNKALRAKIYAMFYSEKTGYDIAKELDIEQAYVYRIIDEFRKSERQASSSKKSMVVIDSSQIQQTSLLLSRQPTHNFVLITNNKKLKILAEKLGFFDK